MKKYLRNAKIEARMEQKGGNAMKKQQKRESLIAQSGAIMLEIVAVLSLMGLMGTMLFRQIYLRNQELHNIQMASEIRTVKEAFSAWLQDNPDKVAGGGYNCTKLDTISNYTSVSTYLPDGFLGVFADPDAAGAALAANYQLFVSCGNVGTVGRCYGIVMPVKDVLPDSGATDASSWNFKRAARVAMLIGADGGVVSESTGVTNGMVWGAAGAWTLTDCRDDDDRDYPSYVAITALDVFQPEVELPSMKVSLPNEWSVALKNVASYGRLIAGAPEDKSCYTLGGARTLVLSSYEDDTGLGALGEFSSDTIIEPHPETPTNKNCWPAFYVAYSKDSVKATLPDGSDVQKAKGDVYVLNDLHVGYDYYDGTTKMRFDKDGMIVFNETVPDPQLSNPTGTPDQQNEHKLNYMLDPAYTSVMNDIKIMSRGGAKLSEILPNYILKSVTDLTFVNRPTSVGTGCCDDHNCSGSASQSLCIIDKPECPTGYLRALAIHPTQWDAAFVKSDGTIDIKSPEVPNAVDLSDGKLNTEVLKALPGPCVRVLEVNDDTGSAAYGTPGGLRVTEHEKHSKWQVVMGYYNNSAGCDYSTMPSNSAIRAIAYTYCVFDENQIDWNSDGTVNTTDLTHKPKAHRTKDDLDCTKLVTQATCVMNGCTWNGATGCKSASGGGGGGGEGE